MAKSGYKMQIYPNGEFTVGYVRPKKFDLEPLPASGVEVFKWGWLTEDNKQIVADWVKERVDASLPLDSSNPANSHKRGLNGITTRGARLVRNAAYLLQKRYGRERLSFLTMTLPALNREEFAAIAHQWSEIVRMFTQELRRELQRHDLPVDYVGCTEIQEKRFRRSGDLGLHLHITFVGRASGRSPWAIAPIFFRQKWNAILARIVGAGRVSNAAENLQMVKKSAEGYLGKYLSKGTQIIGEIVEVYGPDVVPSAWYTCSMGLKQLVKANTHRAWEQGETLWGDLPVMQESGALLWLGFHKVQILGRDFLVGCSGKFDLEKLRWYHDEYYSITAQARGIKWEYLPT